MQSFIKINILGFKRSLRDPLLIEISNLVYIVAVQINQLMAR